MTEYDAQISLGRLCAMLETVRKVDAMFPAQALHVLALVAAYPGISTQTIMARTGISQPSASRNLMKLGNRPHAARYRGLDLVDVDFYSDDARSHTHSLTPVGRTFVARMLTAQTGQRLTANDLPDL